MTDVSEWAAFGGRLTEALREVGDRVFLVVYSRANPKAFVQFAGGEHELHAEAAGGFGDLAAAGWVAPSGDPPNWSCSMPLPALTAEYAALASRCVVALRDVYGLSGPDGLVYKAWREPERSSGGSSADPGENPLALSWLGLPSAHAASGQRAT